jgi:hypothetical protein
MERALNETNRRRSKQEEYNALHGITPTTIKRDISDIWPDVSNRDSVMIDTGDEDTPHLVGHNLRAISRIWKAACARPPPTSNSKPPPACATRSASSKRRARPPRPPEARARHRQQHRRQTWDAQDALREAAADADGGKAPGAVAAEYRQMIRCGQVRRLLP